MSTALVVGGTAKTTTSFTLMRILSESEIELSAALMQRRSVRAKPETPRSTGVHVQAVNKKLAQAAGKLDSDGPDSFADGKYPILAGLGVAWEEFRATHFLEDELLWQVGEWERDGIFGTPDGLWIADVETSIWECKLTTAKRKRIDECWLYMKQGLSYCAMSGNTRVLYDVLWLLGDYSRPYQPSGTRTLVEFEEREVEAWWSIVKRTAKDVTPEGATSGV